MNGTSVSFGDIVSPPHAFFDFAETYPDQVRVTGAFTPIGSAQEMRQLLHTNSAVNAAIRPEPDVGDLWLIEPAEGDCDDYACTKRARLLTVGWPTSALLLAVVQIPTSEFHLVLVARLPHGDLVLDNLQAALLDPITDHYRWIAIQDPSDPMTWRRAIVSPEEEGKAA